VLWSRKEPHSFGRAEAVTRCVTGNYGFGSSLLFSTHQFITITSSVAESHQNDAAAGQNFDAGPGALSPVPAPTLLYTQPTFLKLTKVNIRVGATLEPEPHQVAAPAPAPSK
jgi:hypothetical protein